MNKINKLTRQQIFVVTFLILYSIGLLALATVFFFQMDEMFGFFNLMYFTLALTCLIMIAVGDIWIVDNVLEVIKSKKYRIMNKMITSHSKKVIYLDHSKFQRRA